MLDHAPAKASYRRPKFLSAYGLLAIVVSVPMFVLAWGNASAGWIAVFVFASGVLALALAAALGICNFLYLRRNPRGADVSKVIE